MVMSSSRDEFVEKWAPRVGEEAASLSVKAARLVGMGGLLVPVWAVLFVVGHNNIFLLAIASFVAVLDVILLAQGIVLTSRLHRILSERFQTRVWFLNSPSLRDGQFQAWCGRHGVDPEIGRPAVPK